MSVTLPIFQDLFSPLFYSPLSGPWGGTVVPANPIATLFAGGVRGFAFTPWDVTTLFQDSAGTTPVTADGDPVGLMRDVSGNGNHATSTGTKRPLYKTSGGLSWLQPDAVDDSMQIASLALSTTMHEWLAYDQTLGVSMFFMEHSANAGANDGHFFLGSNNSAWTLRRSSATNSAAGVSQWANGLHVNERIYTALVGGAYRKDGVDQSNGTITGSGRAEAVVTAAYNLFSRNQASLFSAGKYYGHILADGAGVADNAAIYNLLKSKAGL
jgi:hypothetical protein